MIRILCSISSKVRERKYEDESGNAMHGSRNIRSGLCVVTIAIIGIAYPKLVDWDEAGGNFKHIHGAITST